MCYYGIILARNVLPASRLEVGDGLGWVGLGSRSGEGWSGGVAARREKGGGVFLHHLHPIHQL